MTDSPHPRIPLDPSEQPILDRLFQIRDKLSLLKQDRSTYIRSQDVMKLYEEVMQQVERLNTLRTHKPEEQNKGIADGPDSSPWPFRAVFTNSISHKVDLVLDDCFALISLFFLTIGRNQEAPAV